MILNLISDYSKLWEKKFEKNNDDTFVDKLVRKFSAIILFIFASTLGIAQLVGKPIECWCHNEYSGSRCKYATTYCYITSFYIPVGNSTELPRREDLESHRILYYQWVPFIFLLQAFLFYFPSMVWRALYSRAELDLKAYVDTLKKDDSDLKDSQAVKFVIYNIETCLNYKRNYHPRGRVKSFISRNGLFNFSCYISLSYIFTKILYLFIVIVQLIILNYWLNDEHYKTDLFVGWKNWRLSERFPRMTLCKFQVYILQDQQTHWVQCTLPINIYIEKMYIIIWVWLWILFAAIIVDTICQLWLILWPKSFLKGEIQGFSKIDNGDRDLNEFRSVITSDGALVLSLVKENTNRYYVSNILTQLFENFRNNTSKSSRKGED